MLDRMRRKEAAAYLHISVDTLDKRRADGKISAIKDGGLIFYEKSELDHYHESLKPRPIENIYGTYRKRRVKLA